MESPQQYCERNTLEFLGQADEYFKIWIVNLILSLLTLGLYSAWAKVRTKRYFYGNTLLRRTAFDYIADPVIILKRRVITLALLLLFAYASFLPQYVQGALWLVFLIALPLIVVKALNFHFNNTTYGNIRFNFDGTYLRAMRVYLGLPLLLILTLGLTYPYFVREQKKFIVDNSSFGTASFALTASWHQFYTVYVKALIITAIPVILFAAVYSGPLLPATASLDFDTTSSLPLTLSGGLLLFMPIYAYIHTKSSNLVVNSLTLRQQRFESTLETGKICWLYFSNLLAIIVSVGLLIPWAMIRTARYKASCVSLIAHGDIDTFITCEQNSEKTISGEIGDLFEINLDL